MKKHKDNYKYITDNKTKKSDFQICEMFDNNCDFIWKVVRCFRTWQHLYVRQCRVKQVLIDLYRYLAMCICLHVSMCILPASVKRLCVKFKKKKNKLKVNASIELLILEYILWNFLDKYLFVITKCERTYFVKLKNYQVSAKCWWIEMSVWNSKKKYKLVGWLVSWFHDMSTLV